MKGTIMLLDNKGNNVAIPAGFNSLNRMSQEHFLAPLREVLEPRSHKGAHGFSLQERAEQHLK
jgi:gamma-glutamyltranspeptidase